MLSIFKRLFAKPNQTNKSSFTDVNNQGIKFNNKRKILSTMVHEQTPLTGKMIVARLQASGVTLCRKNVGATLTVMSKEGLVARNNSMKGYGLTAAGRDYLRNQPQRKQYTHKKAVAGLCILAVLVVTGCARNGDNIRGVANGGGINKSDIGTLSGAGLGAWGGSNIGKGSGNIAAIAAGTLLGAWAGSEVGASLDRADMAYYNQTSQRALEITPVGTTSTWSNPDSGNSGSFTPTRTIQNGGEVCREYNQTVNVGGRSQQAYGVACRQPDGSWQIRQ